jgi:glycosyltransferase involved in cell wall biosynthesis
MKITFILPGIGLGGGTKVVMIHARALINLGHEVTLVSPAPKASMLQRLFKSRGREGKLGTLADVSFPEAKFLDCRLIDRHRPIIDKDIPDADIVIATWWETAEWVNLLSPAKGRKVYFIQHHEVFPYLPLERSRATYRLPLRKIVVANWLKEVMRDCYDDENVVVVPNGVDRSQFYSVNRVKQATPTVGMLYATAPFKGLDKAQAAIRRLRQAIPNTKVVYFGSQQPGQGSPLEPDYIFHYRPAQENIRHIYSACDAWLTASTSEGFNLPAMEAMACGTPVVSTRTGWPAEAIVQHVNGVLTDVGDVDALTAGLEWIMTRTHSQWNELSCAATKTIESCSWHHSTKLLESTLSEMLDKS